MPRISQIKMIYKKESYDIIGILFEVHNNLGGGFLEVVYKDAMEYEFKMQNIHFEREKEYIVNYKDIVLPHKFFADFVVFDNIILEIKSVKEFHPKHIAQCINYLKVSKNKLCILVNFQNDSLEFKRIVL
jgi:GxxExxY protein